MKLRNWRCIPRSSFGVRSALWLAAIVSITAFAAASPRSSQLIDEGLGHLQKQELTQAAALFEQAAAADADDSEAPFFLGVALNRLARGGPALRELRRSRALGGNNPDLSFEFGWSYLLQHDWANAIAELTAYEKAHPGERAQASLFLGRAYLAERDYARAQAAFERAIALAPDDQDLKEAVQIAQLRLAEARGDMKGADETMKAVARLVLPALSATSNPALGFTPILRPDLVLTDSPRPTSLPPISSDRPWWLNLSLGAGYDSAARGDSAEIFAYHSPADPSAFAEIRLDSGYAFYNQPDGAFWLAYRMFDRTYARQRIRADLLDNDFSANVERQIAPTLRATLRVSDDYTLVRYGNFRNEIGAGATCDWDVKPNLRLEIGYSYVHDDYLSRVPIEYLTYPRPEYGRPLDRDAENHLLRTAVYWTVPNSSWQTRVGYFHAWNFAQGSDFDYESNSFFAGVTAPLFCQISADLSYTRTLEQYKNDNSGIDVLTRRRDPIDSITLGLVRPIAARATAYLTYNFNSDGSNVPFYSYSQHVFSIGVTLQF
ncbi:MAG TPA: tetratricopeptide repeat protein [Tepidisphaeraceae bacterium]|jgi:Flp pilus assembly protein TadD|nr:tetratricopeptide repeat protein [Tepidisphaeraceae bacterium]